MYSIYGLEEQFLVTGGACNTLRQFETGLGPGYFSRDLEGRPDSLRQGEQ